MLRWHGCQFAVAAAAATAVAAPLGGPGVARVRSKVFEVEYRVNEAAMPLDTVRLWYTRDKGATWQLYGQDPDSQSPIRFEAPQEGLYGFWCVVTNAAGTSGPEPQAGTAAQSWAYVDFTPPVVQLRRPVAQPASSGRDTVAIRWAAIDAHLPPRPVSLAYKVTSDGNWHTMVSRLANTGRYDWRVPDDLHGRIVVRITVADRGGNHADAATTFDLAPAAPPKETPQPDPNDQPDSVATLTAAGTQLDEATRIRSRQLYEAALWHQKRGQSRLAIARLRDALRLDPTLTLALVDLASILYGEGDHEASMQAYQLSLKQTPGLRSGLEGAARVSIAQRDFGQAAKYLRMILHDHPNDAETWLNLGDVAIYQGDELAARQRYNQAATLDPTATEVITRARMRLDDLPWLRDRYQPTAPKP